MTAGYDPIWFGVYLVIMVEMAQITPPVGFNLFVIQGLTSTSIGRVARAALPFFLIMALGVALIAIFPPDRPRPSQTDLRLRART